MPPEFTDIGDFSFPFVDPDGNVLGTATIKGGKLRVTLSDAVEGMSSLTLTGSYNQRISRSASQGSTTLNFPTSGGNVPVPITVLPCEGSCTRMPTQPTKSGKLVGDHLEMVGQTPTFADATTYTFVETLTSPGQEFDCDAVNFTARSFTGKDPSTGEPTGGKREPVTITSCTPTKVEGTSRTSRDDSFARLYWDVQVTDEDVTEWTDELQISTNRTWTTTETVKRQSGIGYGQGQFTSTTTTTTSTTSTSTTSTSTTSTSTTSTSTTTTPSTSSTTPRTTTSTTPTPTSVTTRVLAYTGSRMWPLLVAATLFLVLGGALLVGSRRRGTHT